jgi:hypothetical protein
MTEFEKWQKEFEEREALSSQTTTAAENAPLSEIDQAVHDLCMEFSEAAVLAAPAEQATETPTEQTTKATAEAHSLSASDFSLAFGRSVTSKETVEEAYQQLVGIAEELCEELVIRQWNGSKDFVDEHISHVQVAHDSGQIEGLVSSVNEALGRFKTGLERYAELATKTQSIKADVGELFLLTALSAHELRRALHEVYDC